MKIYYNNYNSIEPKAAGASLYYCEISKLLKEQENNSKTQFIPFDFKKVILGKIKFTKLTKNDVVLCNSGPYGWLYHYIREKYNGKYSIVRDVQTALWSPDIFQEQLCNSLTKENDKIIFPSVYCKQLFMKLFPDSLNKNNTFLCYPILHFLPKKIGKRKKKKKELILGWIGRVSSDKNFMQAVDIFIRVAKRLKDRNVKMLVVGPVFNDKLNSKIIKKIIKENGLSPDTYFHLSNKTIFQKKLIFNIFNKIDIFLFPSVANVESLGRTLLEANHFSIPIIAANHATASTLVNKKNLLKVKYFKKEFNLIEARSLGSIDTEEASEKIVNGDLIVENNNYKYENHDKKLIKILSDRGFKENFSELDSSVLEFIDRVRIYTYGNTKLRKDDMMKQAAKLLKKQRGGILNMCDILKEMNFNIFCKIQ